MTYGYAGQHVLLHVDSGVRHSATEAGWAKTAAFAGESYELRVTAAAANEVQAACGQEPAAQVLLELTDHELRETAMLGEVFQHLGPSAVAGMAGMPAGGMQGMAGAGGMSVHPMPSCRGLAADCGPNSNEDCCTSLLVPGGTFDRANDPLYPATVSDFRLDKYEVTVGRFRKFVEAYDALRASGHPLANEGKHPLIPGTGWDVNWSVSLPMDAAGLRAALKCPDSYFPYAFYTWVDVPGVEETRPINCVTWYEASMCRWASKPAAS